MMDEIESGIETPPAGPHPVETGPDAPTMPRAHHSALLIVFLVVFIDLLGFGIVLPLLPRFAKEYIPGGVASPWTGPIIGLLMASFSAMQFIFAPIYGRISDRIGRRPILLLGLASSVVFYGLFGFACIVGSEGKQELALVLLFVSRIGAGIAGATIGTAQAAIADSTTPDKRSRGMALIGAAFGIGFTFGPLIGAGALWLTSDYAGSPGFVAAAISLVALVLAVAILPETYKAGSLGHLRRHWLDIHGLQTALRTPTIGLLILMFFLSTFSFAMFEPTLALLLDTPGLNLDKRNTFLVFTYVGFVLALAQGVLYRRLAARLNEITFIWVGAGLMALGLGGIGAVARLTEEPGVSLMPSLLGALAVAVTGFAFMTPSVQALISRRSDPTRQGEILGVNQSANAMARILGPAIGTPLFYLSNTSHLVPYAVGAALLFLVLLLSVAVRHE
jgi:MFS family permease